MERTPEASFDAELVVHLDVAAASVLMVGASTALVIQLETHDQDPFGHGTGFGGAGGGDGSVRSRHLVSRR